MLHDNFFDISLSDLVAQSLKTSITDSKAISNIKINKAIKSVTELHPLIKKHFITDNKLYVPNIVYAIVLYDLFILGRNKNHGGIFSYSLKVTQENESIFYVRLKDIKEEANKLKEVEFITEEEESMVKISYKGVELRRYRGNTIKNLKSNPHKKNKKNAFYDEFKLDELKSNKLKKVEFQSKKKKIINKTVPPKDLLQNQEKQPQLLSQSHFLVNSIPAVSFPPQVILQSEYYSNDDKKTNHLIPGFDEDSDDFFLPDVTYTEVDFAHQFKSYIIPQGGNDNDSEFEDDFKKYNNLMYFQNINFFQSQYSENISNQKYNAEKSTVPVTNKNKTSFLK